MSSESDKQLLLDAEKAIVRNLMMEAEITRLRKLVEAKDEAISSAKHALRSYEFGNSSSDLARNIADFCEAALELK